MKKVLFGTTALLAASMISTPASAAETVALELGGFMDWYVASNSNDSDYLAANTVQANNFDVMGDGEIYFEGNGKLDNGLTVGVMVELEAGTDAATQTDPVDESYITIGTGYGKVMLGSVDSAAHIMHVSAPDVGRLGINETDLMNMVLVPNAVQGLNSTALNTSNEANKINYISPEYYGVQMGMSYIPGSNATGIGSSSEATIMQTDFEEGYDVSAVYQDQFQGVGVTVSSSYANYNVGGVEHRSEWNAGTSMTYQGFTLGGAFRHVDDPRYNQGGAAVKTNANLMGLVSNNNGVNSTNTGGANDGYAWNLGMSYEAGPYGVSLAYFKSSVEDNFAAAPAVNANEDEIEMYQLSGKYNLGAGVDTFATFGYADYDDETEIKANNNDGWAFVTGVALKF